MSDLTFLLQGGDPVALSRDGNYAVIESEFVPWTVRWNGPDRGSPFAVEGGEIVQLVEGEMGYVVPERVARKKKGKKKYDRLGGRAGVVTLYADSECKIPLSPWLRVDPANLSNADFRAILVDLRALALDLSIYQEQLQVSGSRVSESGVTSPSMLRRVEGAVRATQKCLAAYIAQLGELQRRPSRSLHRRQRLVRADEALRRGRAAETFRWPEERRVIPAQLPEYTTETKEAAFVFGTLAQLCAEADGFCRLAEARVGDLNAAGEEINAVRRRYGMQLPGQVGESAADINQLTEVVTTVQQMIANLAGQVMPERMKADHVTHHTNRLRMSPTYRPFLLAWEEYRRAVSSPLQGVNLLTSLDEHAVAKTSTLYERWATLKIYSAFVARGFSVPPRGQSMLEAVSIESGDIEYLERAEGFALERYCHERLVELRFRQEPTLPINDGFLRPDLVIEARVGNKVETWVLDHKYKDYSRPAPSYDGNAGDYASHFLHDLVGVAEVKYRAAFGFQVGGIIHPDQRPDYSFWDPLKGERPDGLNGPSSHAHLAVCLTPGDVGRTNLTKLVRLLLGFRLGLVSTCWNCGTDCTSAPKSANHQRQTQGTFFSCGGCGAGWIVHWCRQCGFEPLMKFGRHSFHRVEPDDPYNVHCPECGDHFVPRARVAPNWAAGGRVADPFALLETDDDDEPF